MRWTNASNASSAQQSFFERQAYKSNYPAGIRDYRKIDFWYDEILWGRVDRDGNIVYPSEAFMKQLHNVKEESYFVLNFVADAYESFKNEMRLQQDQNHFINLDGTPFEDRFEPTRAWLGVNAAYNTYIQDYYDSFVGPFMSSPDVRDDIKDFDDFIIAFTRLVGRTSLLIPVTKTEYIVSKYGSPLTSGLIVEFAAKDHGDDPTKILDFVNNINFELYREIASRNGFAVDMNAPWRLIADIGSDAMTEFMGVYNVDLPMVFEKYYYKSSFFDIPNLKIYLRTFWNMFAAAHPTIHIPHPTTRKSSGRKIVLTKTQKRVTLAQGEFRERYNNLFWIRLYIYVRAQETNRDWDQYKFDHVVKKATDFFQYSGEQAMLKFIHKEVKRPPREYYQVEEQRQGSFRFKRKRE